MTSRGPLAGVRVVELAGIGPSPFAGMLLGDLGADVLRLDRPATVAGHEPAASRWDILQRNKRSAGLDLKSAEGAALVLDLVSTADILLEGFRPGVTERLGIGPAECLARNRSLVYGRMTGWGQDGPLAASAGHDIDYIALSGTLSLLGREGERPVPPVNLVGDFGGGGMLLVVGVLAALANARAGGDGQVVDAAMVDGSALLAAMLWSFRSLGVWSDERGTNLLDTGAPFYEVYECADGKYVAVGALEPQFFAELCALTGLVVPDGSAQNDRSWWHEGKDRFAEVFRTRSRDEWVALTEGTDACVAPVLTLDEAPAHPHNAARQTFVEVEGVVQPAGAPRFSETPSQLRSPPCWPGEHGREALIEWGVEPERLAALEAGGVLRLLD